MTQFYCSLIAGLAHIMTVKTNLILSLLFIVSLLQAQSFTEIPSPTPFPRVERGSVAVADINGDSLIDVLITGQNDNFQSIAQLYLQDEAGNFTLMPNTPFEGVSHSTAVFADVNGNTYPDLLITGENSDDEPITKLYINDGEGNFIERMDTPFIGVAEGSIGFADVNEDSYPDVLITGRSTDNENDRLARLYTNDGTGIFSEMTDTPFTPVVRGSVAFGDINGDNFADVFITGRVDPGTRIAELYVNDGTGNFSIVEEVPFAGVEEGVGVMVDVNGDSFLDVFIAGVFGRPQLYTNDGNGIFTELTDTPFLSSFSLVSAAFSDVNGDTFADLLIAGRASGLSRTQLYTNDGTGNFMLVEDTPFAGATSGAMVFQDINGDDHTDLFLIGNDEEFFPLAAYYTGDGTGQFAEVRNIPEAITDGSVAFADVNGDNYPDLIVTGESLAEDAVTVLYTNDGTGQFTAITNSPLDSVEDSSIAFADVNGNNYPDVLITGRNSNFERIAKLYTNDGAGNFTEVGDTPFAGVNNGAVAFADVNGDTYLDLLITGDNSSLGRIAQLYINDGTGIFSEVANVPFTGVEYGAIAFADINEDTHLDVLITGEDGNSTPVTQLFT
nr:VCBS repeat-containing protein [Saprospiraceae bacterium]